MRIVKILLVFGALISLTGCDFFRMLAGRPTSADIEEIRTEIKRVEQEALQARLDSLEKVRLAREKDSLARVDSFAALDSIVEKTGPLLNPTKFKGISSGEFEARYYVVVGAFRSSANAYSFKHKTDGHGYQSRIFCFNNGLCVVGVCPTDHIREAQRSLKKVSEDSFFPKGAWVLVNE
jgi:cell division protein FtsN